MSNPFESCVFKCFEASKLEIRFVNKNLSTLNRQIALIFIMATNSQLVELQEEIEIIELSENDSNVGHDLNTELLHHLVEFPRFLLKKASDHEIDELIKRNAELINGLLARPVKPLANAMAAGPFVLKEVLMQKLFDAKPNLADETVKEFVNKKLDMTSKRIGVLIAAFARDVASLDRFEEKLVFEVKTQTRGYRRYNELSNQENIYLRGLAFCLSLYVDSFDLTVVCSRLPKDTTCRVEIETTIKNQDGQQCWMRHFVKQFDHLNSDSSYSSRARSDPTFTIKQLIEREEYEQTGILKDSRFCIEVIVRAGELAKIPNAATSMESDD